MFSDEAVDLVTPPPSGARKGWVVTAKLTTSARQQCREITEPAFVCLQTTHVECQAGTDRAYVEQRRVCVCSCEEAAMNCDRSITWHNTSPLADRHTPRLSLSYSILDI